MFKRNKKNNINNDKNTNLTSGKHVNPTYDKPQLAYYDITAMKQVFLTCTCGGTIRKNGDITCKSVDNWFYVYSCPDCGKKYKSMQSYPYTVSEFNLVAEKVEEAPGVEEYVAD